jgi:prolyl-tRNA editing enzyme YbaK/EbsC (Cys-tRNA(Pro) deacylase)
MVSLPNNKKRGDKMVFTKIKHLLDENNISYHLSEHEAVTTSEEAAKIRGVELKTGAKAMICKSKGEYFLIVLPADQRINWRLVKEELGRKDISLASTEQAEAVTGCKRGSVPPFGNILGLETYYDRKLLENDLVNFNPGSLTHSIQMKCTDLVKIVNPKMISITDGDSTSQ